MALLSIDERQDSARRAELAAFLRARREELRPGDVGLPSTRRRRVRGLRREEVASLAGMSTAWYTQLEQARAVHPTGQVIDALARALRLDADECSYLRRLVGLAPGDEHGDEDALRPAVQTLVDELSPVPASVMTPCLEWFAWNDAYAAVFVDPATLPPARRHGLWAAFADPRPLTFEDHAALAASVLARFRFEAAEHPGDPRFEAIVDDLRAVSPEFREAWARHAVHRSVYEGEFVVHHPVVGRVACRPIELKVVHEPSLHMHVHLPASPADREAMCRALTLMS